MSHASEEIQNAFPLHRALARRVDERRRTMRDGEPAVEWTWGGNAEMDAAQGRGWAVVKGDKLHEMICFHEGDDSEFVATKQKR